MNELSVTHERGEYLPIDDETSEVGVGHGTHTPVNDTPRRVLDELSLFQQEKAIYQDLEDAVNEMSEAGMQLASDNAGYYRLKAQSMARLRADGVPVTAARETLKGDADVNDALLMRDMAEVRYKSAYELINVLKLKYRFVTEQIQREWTRPSNR